MCPPVLVPPPQLTPRHSNAQVSTSFFPRLSLPPPRSNLCCAVLLLRAAPLRSRASGNGSAAGSGSGVGGSFTFDDFLTALMIVASRVFAPARSASASAAASASASGSAAARSALLVAASTTGTITPLLPSASASASASTLPSTHHFLRLLYHHILPYAARWTPASPSPSAPSASAPSAAALAACHAPLHRYREVLDVWFHVYRATTPPLAASASATSALMLAADGSSASSSSAADGGAGGAGAEMTFEALCRLAADFEFANLVPAACPPACLPACLPALPFGCWLVVCID
jgi:hypothetical protein